MQPSQAVRSLHSRAKPSFREENRLERVRPFRADVHALMGVCPLTSKARRILLAIRTIDVTGPMAFVPGQLAESDASLGLVAVDVARFICSYGSYSALPATSLEGSKSR